MAATGFSKNCPLLFGGEHQMVCMSQLYPNSIAGPPVFASTTEVLADLMKSVWQLTSFCQTRGRRHRDAPVLGQGQKYCP